MARLTQKEINFWDKAIERSRDLSLARKFYPKAGKPSRVKEVFVSAVKNLSGCDVLLQDKFQQGIYRPELSDDEVKEIAAASVRKDIKNEYLGEVFRKMDYPVYNSAVISDEELGGLVNKVLEEGAQGYHPGEDPRGFADGLIEFPSMHECPEEVAFTYAVVNDERYGKYADPELARNIVTLKAFHNVLLGRFDKASEIRDKHKDYYDNGLMQDLIVGLENHPSFTNTENSEYGLEYLVAVQRSEFGDLFMFDLANRKDNFVKKFDEHIEQNKDKMRPDVDVQALREKHLSVYRRIELSKAIADFLEGRGGTITEEIDQAVASFKNEFTKQKYSERKGVPYEKLKKELDEGLLHKAFDKTEDRFWRFWGIERVRLLLKDQEYVEHIGKEGVRQILNERVQKALENGKAHSVYTLAYGTNLGHGGKCAAVPQFCEYVDIDRMGLLEKMIDSIDWDPEHLLSDEYDFSYDNLTFRGTSEVNDAYDLFKTLKREGAQLPPDEKLKKLMFLRMAIHAKEFYEGEGMRTIIDTYEDPNNQSYVNGNQTKRLLTKVFDENFYKGFRKVRNGTGIGGKNHTQPDYVSYFYALASSKLGEVMKGDQRLEPYAKLHSFVEGKQN